jgi:hypothetical protein
MYAVLAHALLLCGLLSAQAAQAAAIAFATVDEGRAIVMTRDEYIERLGPLERSLKAKSAEAVSEGEFLALAASAVRPWTAEERTAVQRAFEAIAPDLDKLRLPLPPRVVLIRATGAGEGGAPHTRGHAVVMTDGAFREPARLSFLLAHELFHVASRHDRRWRDAMYATIGFVAIDELVLPPPLAQRRITNPDAPRLDVAIRVRSGGQVLWVAPLLQASVDRYDATRGAEFFATMQLVWLKVGRGDGPPRALADPPRQFRTADLADFAEQVGRNTGYVIHPEEILADNVAQIMTGLPPLSPEVHARIRRVLTAR